MRQIFINFNLCQDCQKCEAGCSYPYHPGNQGIEALREKIMSQLYCRKCDLHLCEKVCAKQAIEVNESQGFKRNIFQCISCYNCALACPFGVLYQSSLVYRSNICDQCPDREPECIRTCPKEAIKIIEDSEVKVGAGLKPALATDGILVISEEWHKEEP